MLHRVFLIASLAIAGLGLVAAPAVAGGTISGKIEAKKKKYKNNTIVYLKSVPGKHKPQTVKMDQRNQKFIPMVLPVVKGSTVQFLNNDNTGHNVFSPDGERYDLGTWDKGQVRSHKFTKTGVYTQLCKMHPSMIAYVVVLDNPYFAVTKADGSFEIKGVPPGTYTVQVWNERKKAAPTEVTVRSGAKSEIAIKLGK